MSKFIPQGGAEAAFQRLASEFAVVAAVALAIHFQPFGLDYIVMITFATLNMRLGPAS